MDVPDISHGLTFGSAIVLQNKVVHVDEAFASLFGFTSLVDLKSFISTPLHLISHDFHQKVLSKSMSTSFASDSMDPNGEIFFTANRFGKTIAVFSLMQKTTWNKKSALEILLFDISSKVSPHQLINRPKYESLIKNSVQGVVIHRFFKPLLINQAWADLMGVDSKDDFLENGSVLDVIPKIHHAGALDRCEKVLRGEAVGESHIIENIRLDGTKRFFNIYDHAINWEGEPALEVVAVDVTDKVVAQQELAYRADHDSLTDLLNRDALYKWIKEHCLDVKSMSCILFDIDNFKNVNDSYGHEVGDSVLRHLSSIIKKQVGDDGVVGRWGGEEFIIFLAESSQEVSYELAEKIRSSCESSILNSQYGDIKNTLSIGVSFTDDFSNTMPKDLIRIADERMYISKQSGKNRVS
ncbi:diguanylate cyclase [Vibrio sp. DW001]|uniref:sensor domain-containing diguanylate cyclase n=1 Tax=Vibrio sp. DW001 TaxID=2912315 RepID=UPI0023B0B5E7|nr:sensor domain-containing diguanylate cyclase [Vibrio sp. DW001]WED27487.1 diguanylate cyclase [Vibrio sp. DW001]